MWEIGQELVCVNSGCWYYGTHQVAETDHIINCLRCIDGKGYKKIPPDYLGGVKKWIGIFESELKRRGQA